MGDIERRWRIVRRIAVGYGDDWHIADGPDPGDDPEGVEVVPARENEQLRQALIPFAFIGRQSMESLGLVDEYDYARSLLGLDDA